MNAEQAYKVLQNASGIKVGDTVKVLRKAKDYEMGWATNWAPEMDKLVGEKFKVIAVNNGDGVLIKDKIHKWFFPFFVLEAVKSKPVLIKVKLNDEYTADVYRNKIVVGCQTFDTSIAQKLLDAVKKMQKKS